MRTALVTGGSRGIGRAIVLRLARDGLRVGVHYGRDDEAARRTLGELEQAGGQGFLVKADLEEPVDAVWKEFDRYADGLDVLVNNAGIGRHMPLADVTPEWFDRLFAVNAKAPFFLVQQAILSALSIGDRASAPRHVHGEARQCERYQQAQALR